MNEFIVGGIDIRNYLPEKFPEEDISRVRDLGLDITNAIRQRILIGLSHGGIRRIAMAHAIFGQYPTSEESTAEKAIGISAYQIHSDRPKDSKE